MISSIFAEPLVKDTDTDVFSTDHPAFETNKPNIVQAQAQRQDGQNLPYDEFRPRTEQVQPQPPASPQLLSPGQISPQIRPETFTLPGQSFEVPGQTGGNIQQPYNEFEDQQTPPPQPPVLTGPGGLSPVPQEQPYDEFREDEEPPELTGPGGLSPVTPPSVQPPIASPTYDDPQLIAPGQSSDPPPTSSPSFAAPGIPADGGQEIQPPQFSAPGIPVSPPIVSPPVTETPLPPGFAVPSVPPDLEFVFDGLPDRIVQGKEIGRPARIIARNIGGGTAPGNRARQRGYIIDLMLSSDDRVPEGYGRYSENYREDVLLRGGRVSETRNLAGRASAAFLIDDDAIPRDTPPGQYYICGRIDPGDFVSESNENNNVACTPIRVDADPRLTPPPGAPGSSLAPGTTGFDITDLDDRPPGLEEPDIPAISVPEPEAPPLLANPLFDFDFDGPVLPEPANYRSNNIICDFYCSYKKIWTPVMVLGWPIPPENADAEFRLDYIFNPGWFEEELYYSVPFNSANNETSATPVLSELAARANAPIPSASEFRKLGERRTYVSGQNVTFASVEGLQSTFSYWIRILRRTPEGWQPVAQNLCLIPVCPADSIR